MGYTVNSIGKKFNADGTVRHFPGNTIISMVNPNQEIFAHFLRIRHLLEESPAAPCVTLLPLSSIHMTVIEGVCDQVRQADHWTSLLPPDCSLAETDAFFEERLADVPPLEPVTLRMTHVVFTGAILLRLEPVTQANAARLKRYRNDVSTALGLRFPNHDSYRFHISLGYFTKEPTQREAQALHAFGEQADRYIAQHEILMQAQPPQLMFFDDMFRFVPHRIPRDGQQECP